MTLRYAKRPVQTKRTVNIQSPTGIGSKVNLPPRWKYYQQQDCEGNSKEIANLYYGRVVYIQMGFLDKLRGKKQNQPAKEETQKEHSSGQQQGKRIKKYTSDGKPVYE